MTLLQMKAIVLAAQLGSISAAAKELNISQSNVSAYIKDVEQELGVQLLIRNRKGIIATEQGNEFLEHAKKIFDEQDFIMSINKLKHFYRLRVGSMNFGIARNVFNKLCIEHANDSNIDMQYINTSITKGIQMLKEHKLDVVVGFIRNDLITKVGWIIESYNIEKKTLGSMKAYIRMNKNHPLIKTGINEDGTINVAMLKYYPYIDYDSFKDEDFSISFNNNFEDGGFHQIFISDEKSRYEIISKTNTYCMGTNLPKNIKEQYGIVCIPVKDLYAEFCVLTRNNDINNQIISKYVELLEKQGNEYLKRLEN